MTAPWDLPDAWPYITAAMLGIYLAAIIVSAVFLLERAWFRRHA